MNDKQRRPGLRIQCEVAPGTFVYGWRMPSRFHRFVLRLLLGWRFTELPPEPEERVVLYG